MSGSNQALSADSTRYPLDKIFYKPATATVSVSQSANPISPTITTVTANNPESRLFFIDMQISPDGFTWYDSGLEPFYKDGVTNLIHKRFAGSWFMIASTITFNFYANDASYGLRYRLVGYSLE